MLLLLLLLLLLLVAVLGADVLSSPTSAAAAVDGVGLSGRGGGGALGFFTRTGPGVVSNFCKKEEMEKKGVSLKKSTMQSTVKIYQINFFFANGTPQ